MAVNKVIYNGSTVMDISDSTITADKILNGFIGYDKAGNRITGTASSGGGGLPSGISAIDFGTINITSAFTTTRQTFQHKLGVTPDFVMVWTPSNIATTYSMLCAIRSNQHGWRSSAYNNHYAYHGNSTTNALWANTNSTSYGVSNMTATTFQLASASSSHYWREGTYNYIAIKFA